MAKKSSASRNGPQPASRPERLVSRKAGDILNIVPPETALYVTKDIALGVISPNGGFITISQVTQSFHQVPEPATMIAGALLLLPFGASTLRVLRKRQTA